MLNPKQERRYAKHELAEERTGANRSGRTRKIYVCGRELAEYGRIRICRFKTDKILYWRVSDDNESSQANG